MLFSTHLDDMVIVQVLYVGKTSIVKVLCVVLNINPKFPIIFIFPSTDLFQIISPKWRFIRPIPCKWLASPWISSLDQLNIFSLRLNYSCTENRVTMISNKSISTDLLFLWASLCSHYPIIFFCLHYHIKECWCVFMRKLYTRSSSDSS